MAKITVKILLRNKKVKTLKIDPKQTDFEFSGGLYMILDNEIRLNTRGEAELYYFENNPSPINRLDVDSSKKYLDNIIKINFIQQIGMIGKSRGLGLIGALFKDPRTIMAIIMGAIILYAFIQGGFKV